ncbi:DUF2057 domain-containing protein [Marinobacter vulgaris]|uniref:DUF2057 domain-containing protein n=1 Tax=Marinobacter vulgaris TaxID=1928331 RepID=A0A2V3ZG85_9GAMM|nr:DUF2057 family protein [Marinobacter vulgaris]PXX89361.1 DUF2057 domain-containing protein [Marinobacter vulgaris]TSJ68075.1 DUF2057 domain-containing protein [Marinobacter vulgaris]
MNINHVSAFFSKARYPAIALAALLVFSGCSSTMSNVKTWEGDADASRTAVLKSPSEIDVLQVNDLKLTNFLMDDLALDFELLPGENQVLFTYKTIWAKSGVVRNGESKVHVIETAPQAVTIDAQPGETYRFSFEAPASRTEAEVFANDFSAEIVNASGEVVASAGAWDERSAGRTAVARAPVGSGTGEAGSSSSDGAEGQDTLEELKALWGQASEEERRTFLRWAFE